MSVFIPYIRNYAPFYIQRESDALAVDIQRAYGVTIKTHDYPAKIKAKQPYKNDWLDRDGDDECADHIVYEAFTLRLSCVIMVNGQDSTSVREELKNAALEFKDALQGDWFRVYDAWTRSGFRKVRLAEFPEIREGDFRERGKQCRLIFDLSLALGDPVTQVRYQNGVLVDVKTHGDSVLVLAAEDSRYVITEDGKLILM